MIWVNPSLCIFFWASPLSEHAVTVHIKSDFVSFSDEPGATLNMIIQEKHQHSDIRLDCNFE